MFELITKRFTREKQEPEKTTALQVPEPSGNTIVFLYDDADRDLWYDLAPHINTLVLRSPNVFSWKYYCYPTPMTRGESQHEAFVHDLEQAFLFLPCTSATFLTHFWTSCKIDTRMTPLLAQRYVQPIPLRAAHGVSQSILAQPLSAYPAGHAREAACVQVVAALEQKLLGYQRHRQGETQAPVALLAETTSKRVAV
jgi:hypothetical protein